MTESLDALLRGSARVADEDLHPEQLADAMDGLWRHAKSEAPAAVPRRRTKVRRRVVAAVAALVVAGVGAGGAPAFAEWVSLHTGNYDTGVRSDPEPTSPGHELWRVDSKELTPQLLTWEKEYPLAPGYTLNPLADSYSGLKNTQMTAGMVQDNVFFFSQCTWVDYWVTADHDGDAAAKKQATQGLVETIAKLDTVQTLDEHGHDYERELLRAAKDDVPATLKSERRINCDWNFR